MGFTSGFSTAKFLIKPMANWTSESPISSYDCQVHELIHEFDNQKLTVLLGIYLEPMWVYLVPVHIWIDIN